MSKIEIAKKHFFEGISFFETHKYKYALEQFETVLELHPNHIPSIENALICCAELGKWTQDRAQAVYFGTPQSNRNWRMLVTITSSQICDLAQKEFIQDFILLGLKDTTQPSTMARVLDNLSQLKPADLNDLEFEKIENTQDACELINIVGTYASQTVIDNNASLPLSKIVNFIVSSLSTKAKSKLINECIQLFHAVRDYRNVIKCFDDRAEPLNSHKLTTETYASIADAAAKLRDSEKVRSLIHVIKHSEDRENSLEPLFYCAKAFQHMDDHLVALQILKDLIRSEYQVSRIYLELARSAALTDNLNDAFELFEQLPERIANEAEIKTARINIALYTGRLDVAEALSNRRAIEDPTNQSANSALAQIYMLRRQYTSAFYHLSIATTGKIPSTTPIENFCFPYIGNEGLGDQIVYRKILERLQESAPNIIHTPKLAKFIDHQFPTEKPRDIRQPSSEHFLSEGPYLFLNSEITNSEADKRLAEVPKEEHLSLEARISQLKEAKSFVVCLGSTAPSIGSKKSIDWPSVLQLISQDCDIYCIDYRPASIEQAESQRDPRITIPSNLDTFNDISGVAQLIKNCDFCLLGSNTYAHLSGLLNKPGLVFTTLGFGAIWYWKSPFVTRHQQSTLYPSLSVISAQDICDLICPPKICTNLS